MSADLKVTVKRLVSRSAGAGACVGALLAFGCSDLDPGRDTFTSLGLARQELDPQWGCVGAPPSAPPANPPATVKYTFPLVDWTDPSLPLEGRKVTVCSRADPPCAQPIKVINLPSDPRDVTVELPGGENIFIVMEQPERIRDVLYFAGPLYKDQRGGRIPLLTPTVLMGLASSQRLMLELTDSVVALRSHDCTGAISGGALFEMEGGSVGIPYTVVNDYPTVTDPLTPMATTVLPTELGNVPFAGFANVTPGNIAVRGTVPDMGMDFGQARFVAGPGMITFVEVRPVPWLN